VQPSRPAGASPSVCGWRTVSSYYGEARSLPRGELRATVPASHPPPAACPSARRVRCGGDVSMHETRAPMARLRCVRGVRIRSLLSFLLPDVPVTQHVTVVRAACRKGKAALRNTASRPHSHKHTRTAHPFAAASACASAVCRPLFLPDLRHIQHFIGLQLSPHCTKHALPSHASAASAHSLCCPVHCPYCPMCRHSALYRAAAVAGAGGVHVRLCPVHLPAGGGRLHHTAGPRIAGERSYHYICTCIEHYTTSIY
jgi:hypothetical protein